MRKAKILLGCLLLTSVFISLVTGCSNGSNEKADTRSAGSDQLVIHTMGPGTWPYVSSETLTPYFKEVLPEGFQIEKSPIATGDISGVYLLREKQGDLTMVSDLPAEWVWDGKPYPNIDKEYQQFRKLLQVDSYGGIGFLVSRKIVEENGFETVGDLLTADVPLTIATLPAGSSSLIMTEQIMKGYGIDSLETFESAGNTVLQGGTQDIVKYIRDRQADVYAGLIVGYNFPMVEEMTTSIDMVILPFEQDKLEQISDEFGFHSFTIPENSYKGMTNDTTILGLGGYIIVREDMSDAIAYDLTKAMYENWSEIQQSDPYFSITEMHFRETVVPFHQGAEKYLKEIGELE
ncbi:TRAP transporter solute receptor, TAXI family [Gracilibacillus ureilyticus]|uniref:TRAP transporter solute receptor, TAXI family n=1 Tax=Gracilibacillus ureilyticus TaxID=531814 RepID=A0A1H9MS27_9BACI|nr:TAXI family TRAP transporter solute-binding subunit [Gracilibacillus ureilyticus]SER26514.1 TRAP transporter solute receptor, TAXI family [Gracilibacillus ureilyticus]